MHYGLTKKQAMLLSVLMPHQFIKEKPSYGSNDGLSYIPGNYVNEILDNVFGIGAWSFEIRNAWKQDSIPFFKKSYDKKSNGSGTLIEQAPFASVLGRLTYFLYPQKDFADEDISKYEPCKFYKEAYGSQVFIGKSDVQQSAFKAAGTDALKKCATLIGVGRELYSKEDISGFTNFRRWLSELTTNEWNSATIAYYNEYIDKIKHLEAIVTNNMNEEQQKTFKKELYRRMNLPENTVTYNPLPNKVVEFASTYNKLLNEVTNNAS